MQTIPGNPGSGMMGKAMKEANGNFWRREAPLWLKMLAVVLLFPTPWLAIVALGAPTLHDFLGFGLTLSLLLVGIVLSALVVWIIVRNSSVRFFVVWIPLLLLAYGAGIGVYRYAWDPILEKPKDVPSWRGPNFPVPTLPEFPWPPPIASASYVLPRNVFDSVSTVGQVAVAITSALERKGYVERSFFRTEADGVALATRLERMNDDGSSSAEAKRWPTETQKEPGLDLGRFLQGLFYVDSGHYRIIVFILQDRPFSQSSERLRGEQARLWLRAGTNVLPREVAGRPFGEGNCTALVYEFASDGAIVRVVESRLTGKQHLEKAGVLALLGTAN